MQLIAVLALLLLVVWLARLLTSETPVYTYVKANALFTPAELNFLRALEQSVGNRYRIMGKVRLGDIIRPDASLTGKGHWTTLRKVAQKHVDYVLCDLATLEIVAVIELDDRSHQRPDRQQRDIFVDGALRAAGIPVVHFRVQRSYSPFEIVRSIETALSPSTFLPGTDLRKR